ncbi:MAG: transporter [Frankiales bacterium]|jgi:DHA1 family bicyclomycin/chloramphenicol resistance-like MFS transporter|nr:transporter [Frankiales bacterium]
MTKTPLGLFLVLGGLSAIGPIATDMYLPALPTMAREQHASTSTVQLTLTACLLGLGIGQVVAGPLSDRFGRRRPLLIGMALFMVASIACALAPNIPVLIATRGLQGLAGAAGVVISRAVVRDLFEGPAVAAMMSRLMLVMGVAPILAPLGGSALLHATSWRGLFWIMTGFALILFIGSLRFVPETLTHHVDDPERVPVGRTLSELFHNPRFVGAVTGGAFAIAAMFAYISGSSFVFQQVFGLNQSVYALIFGLNAVGIIALSQLSAHLVRTHSPAALLLAATTISSLGGIGLLLGALSHAGLPVIVPMLFLSVASVGLALPNSGAIALAGPRNQAGTASATLGLAQFGVGAAVAPLVGAFGGADAVPMAVVICVCAVIAFLAASFTASRKDRPTDDQQLGIAEAAEFGDLVPGA